VSHLFVVDLAGSERLSSAPARGHADPAETPRGKHSPISEVRSTVPVVLWQMIATMQCTLQRALVQTSNLIDALAQETRGKSTAEVYTEVALVQAVSINKSLFNLQRVVRLLSSGLKFDGWNVSCLSTSIARIVCLLGGLAGTRKGNATAAEHIPYRDSKLTWLLRPALSGRFYANFICCITPAHEH
jgi:hypothetical protein